MKRTAACAVRVFASIILIIGRCRQGAQSAAFHPHHPTNNHCFPLPQQQLQQQQQQRYSSASALQSSVESDNVMTAFDQAFAELKKSGAASQPAPADLAENLQSMQISAPQSVSSRVSTGASAKAAPSPVPTAALVNPFQKILKPRPPQTDPPKDAYLQQQQQQLGQRKNAVAVAASKRTFTTAAPGSETAGASVVGGGATKRGPAEDAQQLLFQKNQNNMWTWGTSSSKTLPSESSQRQQQDEYATKQERSSTATTTKTSDQRLDRTDDRQVVSTIGGKMTVPPESRRFGIGQTVATWQSWCLGAAVGTAAVTPVTLLHHFYLYPTYESLAQWEWDTGAALIQGAVFAAVYRYAIRDDWNEEKLGKAVFTGFFLVRSLVGIRVPMSCSTPFLFCK